MPRDELISIIDLAEVLHLDKSVDKMNDKFIETNFSNISTGFHVNEILGIHRVYWKNMRKPESTVATNGEAIAVGVVEINKKIIIVLDFEKIMSDINPEISLKISDIGNKGGRTRNNSPILIAEDSDLLSKMIVNCLKEAGYVNVTSTYDGQQCWDKLTSYAASGKVEEKVACVITDIEMPQMDGHRLTRLIKEDSRFANIPVIIFSSIVNESMIRKGEDLGADAQITKPEIGKLVETIDELIGAKK